MEISYGVYLGVSVYNGRRNGIAYSMRREGHVCAYDLDGATAPAYMVRNGVTYRISTDNQGSVRLVVNAETGEVMQRLDYDSFGRVLRDTNPGFQPFGFQGGLYDPDTGLVEFGCRWYDAETGRWISKDPILLDGGWNVYAFCGNDPVKRADPSGLYSFWQWTSQLIGAVSGAAQAVGGVGLAIFASPSGVGVAAGAVIAANGLTLVATSLFNLYRMRDNDAKLLGNSAMIGLTTSLLTDDSTLNGIAGFADVCVNAIANPIASSKALAAVSEHFGTGELGRLLYDTNHYGTFGKLDRLLSAGQIATQRIQEVETPALLSRIGTMGTFTDATLNIIK